MNEIYVRGSHNPYFNRWFSAISLRTTLPIELVSHNPYFNRWFSAMLQKVQPSLGCRSHNPYFNRWFSAIIKTVPSGNSYKRSQSLF